MCARVFILEKFHGIFLRIEIDRDSTGLDQRKPRDTKSGSLASVFSWLGTICVWMEILQVPVLALEGSFWMNTTSLQCAILKQTES